MTPEKIIQISTTSVADMPDIVYALTNYGNVYKMVIGGDRGYEKLPEFIPGKASKNVK